MKRFLTLLVLGLLTCAGLHAQTMKTVESVSKTKGAGAPKSLTVKQILAKNRAAVGGTLTQRRITSWVGIGTAEIPVAGATGTVEIYSKAPNKQVTLINLKGIGLIADGYDGVVAWSNNPITGLRTKSGTELAQTKAASVFDRDAEVGTLYSKMVAKGVEQVDGHDAYVIEATSPASGVETWYIDAHTFLLVRQDLVADSSQGKIPMQTYFEDYRVVGGVKRAFVTRAVSSAVSVIIRLTELKMNVAIDDAKFAKPKQ